jgi:hypothetical protein
MIQELQRDWVNDIPVRNGIACERCCKELYDSHPACLVLGSNPPKKHIHCGACGYKGTRLA